MALTDDAKLPGKGINSTAESIPAKKIEVTAWSHLDRAMRTTTNRIPQNFNIAISVIRMTACRHFSLWTESKNPTSNGTKKAT